MTQRNGQKFQTFANVGHKNCSDCHKDPHEGKFGLGCSQCHTENSFHTVKGISNFDHSKTAFPLQNKHQLVPCQSCHKGSYSAPVKYSRCDNCHEDYHQKQFVKEGTSPDCAGCHTTRGFQGSSFTVEKHNAAAFKLTGAHLATPCTECHKKQQRWSFREIGKRCSDCHNDIHQLYISNSYYPGKDCEACHQTSAWATVSFDHNKTAFPLEGVHKAQTCRKCHFIKDSTGEVRQRFAGLDKSCRNCHEDIHNSQFEQDGPVNCRRCHGVDNWKIASFDHDKTSFRLDGRHRNVPCQKCHKPVTAGNRTFVLYKIKDTRCESCH
jgi:hypothetical protein